MSQLLVALTLPDTAHDFFTLSKLFYLNLGQIYSHFKVGSNF